LGLSENKTELLVVFSKSGRVIVAESVGAQNITALAKRDQGRPKRDAFVGMLPPKLAQIMLNLALGERYNSPATVLDPFCGTGVLLQEALLMGYSVYGSDLNPKMVDYTKVNLQWLQKNNRHLGTVKDIREGDATTFSWKEAPKLQAVVCETYLGQPFSAPPSPAKLAEVRRTCNAIITSFLKNIGGQIPSGTPLCLAIPAWRDKNGHFSHLPLVQSLSELGYESATLTTVEPQQLLYFREDQVVARQLLVIKKR
ncbi:MAG TPA: methyltransferase domain-containing protein, partial [Candidatus Saccharibacteria bacterium]|nr:methyltransferase domain-containing protein [Candidatus Saccharibacteria bacterium]